MMKVWYHAMILLQLCLIKSKEDYSILINSGYHQTWSKLVWL